MMGARNWRQDWNASLGDLLHGGEKTDRMDRLLQNLSDVAPYQHSVTFGYPPERRPVFLHNGLNAERRRGSVAEYLRGSYLIDPFYEACRNGVQDGVWRMADLAPDDFYASVGAHPGYVSPCVSDLPGVLSEEIGFFATLSGGVRVILSLMRDTGEPPFSEIEMNRLREIEPTVRIVLTLAFATLSTPGLGAQYPSVRLDDVIEIVASGLSPREREVTRLLLLGYSTLAIAETLDIAVSTAKIHRRNLYAKLNISSQSEFYSIFLRAAYGDNPAFVD